MFATTQYSPFSRAAPGSTEARVFANQISTNPDWFTARSYKQLLEKVFGASQGALFISSLKMAELVSKKEFKQGCDFEVNKAQAN